MSKKRKTRKEKMRTAVRIDSSFQQESSTPVYSIENLSDQIQKSSLRSSKVQNTSSPQREEASYAYVVKDMRQTFIITSVLLASSVILYFLIQNQILRLTMFGY